MMDKKLKQRLVIVIIIMTLLIIFLPMLLSRYESNRDFNEASSIPEPPEQSALEKKLDLFDQPKFLLKKSTKLDQGVVDNEKNKISKIEDVVAQPVDEPKTDKEILDAAKEQGAVLKTPLVDTTESTEAFEATKIQPVIPTKEVKEATVPDKSEVIPSIDRVHQKVSSKHLSSTTIHHKNGIKTYKMHSAVKEVDASKRLHSAKIHNRGWVVQLGSFNKVINANQLIQKLRKKGFSAFGYYHSTERGHIVNRVYVGPFVQREEAMKIRHYLNDKMHIKGVIVSFNPVRKGIFK
jgi:DedD protein